MTIPQPIAIALVGMVVTALMLGVIANMRLNDALKPRPVTVPPALPTSANPPKPTEVSEPFTLGDVLKELEWKVRFSEQRVREFEALQAANALPAWHNVREAAKDAAIYRYLAHRIRQEVEAEAFLP
jgi:hypothetical protein